MTKNLKSKTANAMGWTGLDIVGRQVLQFIISIIIARALSPSDYGLIGMLTIFSSLAQCLLDSGFSSALIRKKNIQSYDYSTVFFFNIGLGLLLYGVLYLCAPFIANFYHEPRLVSLSRFIFLSFFINSFGLIQSTILQKKIDFKTSAKISLLSISLTGPIGIFMAYNGFGPWALAIQIFSDSLVRNALFWIFNRWRPTLEFNWRSLKEMFAFGSNLLFAQLLNVVFRNLFQLTIGKVYSSRELGYYAQANRIQETPVQILTSTLQRVSYPVLSLIQDEEQRLKNAYRQIIKVIVFLNFPLMLGLMIVAKPFILVFLTKKWLMTAYYLQLLCLVGLSYPMSAVNLNILKVKGRSDIFFYLETVKKALIVLVIIFTIHLGVKAMLIGQVIMSIVAFFLNIYYSGKTINYSLFQQISDIFPYLAISMGMAFIVYLIKYLVNGSLVLLIIQVCAGILIYLFFAIIFKLEALKEVLKIIKKFRIKRWGNA